MGAALQFARTGRHTYQGVDSNVAQYCRYSASDEDDDDDDDDVLQINVTMDSQNQQQVLMQDDYFRLQATNSEL